NFLNTRRALLTGNVYHDLNGNGAADAGELSAPGWFIFLDDDNDGVLDTAEERTTADSSGEYSLTPLPTSSFTVYRIRLLDQTNWIHTQPQSGSYLKISGPGGTYTNMNFGITLPARL